MYCVGARQDEVDWDVLWKAREQDIKKKAREKNEEKKRKYEQTLLAERRKHRNEIVRKSQRKRRAEAVGNGLCSQCCKGIPAPGRKNCPECLKRAREIARRKRISSI